MRFIFIWLLYGDCEKNEIAINQLELSVAFPLDRTQYTAAPKTKHSKCSSICAMLFFLSIFSLFCFCHWYCWSFGICSVILCIRIRKCKGLCVSTYFFFQFTAYIDVSNFSHAWAEKWRSNFARWKFCSAALQKKKNQIKNKLLKNWRFDWNGNIMGKQFSDCTESFSMWTNNTKNVLATNVKKKLFSIE